MSNAQLSSRERTVVYTDLDSKRILGFAPEGAVLLCPPGTRYSSETLYRAADIERWAKRFREQQDRDAHEATERQIEREKPFRDALRNSILARSARVDNANRALNAAFIRLNDERYDRMMKAKANPEVFIASEAWEEGKDSEKIALMNPAYNSREQHA